LRCLIGSGAICSGRIVANSDITPFSGSVRIVGHPPTMMQPGRRDQISMALQKSRELTMRLLLKRNPDGFYALLLRVRVHTKLVEFQNGKVYHWPHSSLRRSG
jgi:hypothetical protein